MIETSLRVFADLCIIRGTTTPKDIAREQTRNILRNLVKANYDRVNYQLAPMQFARLIKTRIAPKLRAIRKSSLPATSAHRLHEYCDQ
jgi:hypothetical protein